MPELEDEEDDLLPPLPPVGVGDDDELPGDDELGLDGLELGDEESIGLDDSAGVEEGLDDDQALFALDLPPEEDPSDAAEEGVDAIPVEGLDGDDEYGWADAPGESSDEPWDPAELDLPGLAPLGVEDGGEEGVDEHVELAAGDDDASHLPPLAEDPSLDEDDDALSIGEDMLLEEAALSFEDERRQMGAFMPTALEGDDAVVSWLGPDEEIACAEPRGERGWAGGRTGLYAFEDRCERLSASGLEGHEIVSIAVADDGARITVGTRLGAVLCSDDGGRSFTETLDATRAVAQSFHLCRERGSERLWGRTGTGALHRSDDFGRTWSGPLLLKPAVALVAPDEGGVVVLCAGKDAPSQLARSSDGGDRWAAVAGPPLSWGGLADEGELYVAVHGDYVAVSCDTDPGGPFLSSDRGKTWLRVPGLAPTGALAIEREPGGLTLYAAHFFESRDRGVVARHRPDGGEPALVLDVAAEASRRALRDREDPEGVHRVHALSARFDGRRTIVHAATGIGLFRVVVDPEARVP